MSTSDLKGTAGFFSREILCPLDLSNAGCCANELADKTPLLSRILRFLDSTGSSTILGISKVPTIIAFH